MNANACLWVMEYRMWNMFRGVGSHVFISGHLKFKVPLRHIEKGHIDYVDLVLWQESGLECLA